jgi:hypothetical protein
VAQIGLMNRSEFFLPVGSSFVLLLITGAIAWLK